MKIAKEQNHDAILVLAFRVVVCIGRCVPFSVMNATFTLMCLSEARAIFIHWKLR